MPGANTDYTARHLQVLEGLEAVRKRPGMYIGSTDSRGLMHCLWEIIDNSVDEALGGHASAITVVLHDDSSVEVHDDGRGIPVDVEPRTGLSGVEVVFTVLHAGGKFGGGSYTASGGLHGVGASVVNALSERLDVEIDRAGKTYAMSFRRGEPGIFDDSAGRSPSALHAVRRRQRVADRRQAPRGAHGTRIRYWADRQVFLAQAQFSYDELAARARQTSSCRACGSPARRETPRGAVGGRRADPARGGLPPRRRDRGVHRVPRRRPAGHRRVAAQRAGPVHRDRARARRAWPHELAGGDARLRRRHRPALGHGLCRRRCARSSTSSPPPRAAPT